MKAPLFMAAVVAAFACTSVLQAATVLVTGSNRGLGYEFVRQYAAQGWTVIATTRNPESAPELRELAAKNKNIVIEKLDVLDLPGIKALAAKYQGQPIDVLLNNAGVFGDIPGQTFGSLDYANFQQVMSVNVYGPLAVSEAFRDNVIRSEQKKIVAITSGSGTLSRGGGGGRNPFYRASKAALNMVMITLAADLKSRGVAVGLINPGATETDMLRQAMGREKASKAFRPQDSVAGMIKVIAGLTQANSDKPFNHDGTVLPW